MQAPQSTGKIPALALKDLNSHLDAPTTGFDTDATGHMSFPGLPDLLVATFTYDVPPFAAGTKIIELDVQGLILGADSTSGFWTTIGQGPRYAKEYVVSLPIYTNPTTGKQIPATQTEIMHIKDGQFFILAKDSGAGFGKARSESVYRHIDIFDIDEATDIKSPNNDWTTCSMVTSAGKFKSSIKPATYCPFLDFNNNS
ncbi:hypothetical protein B0J14DRAFT_646431 [Halenospora varia]|nr:hypothetical protein B0J14DRAFT_646431 [Halenospora varia]